MKQPQPATTRHGKPGAKPRRARGVPLDGDRVRRLRVCKGWVQSDLAQAMGIGHRDVIAKYETGARRPSPASLKKLAEALGVPPMDLLADPAPRESAA